MRIPGSSIQIALIFRDGSGNEQIVRITTLLIVQFLMIAVFVITVFVITSYSPFVLVALIGAAVGVFSVICTLIYIHYAK